MKMNTDKCHVRYAYFKISIMLTFELKAVANVFCRQNEYTIFSH
jgi:hypothetical protein